MESTSSNKDSAITGNTVDTKPKRKGRGPGLKKKIIYLQSRLCHLKMHRHTIKAQEYSSSDLSKAYIAPPEKDEDEEKK